MNIIVGADAVGVGDVDNAGKTDDIDAGDNGGDANCPGCCLCWCADDAGMSVCGWRF